MMVRNNMQKEKNSVILGEIYFAGLSSKILSGAIIYSYQVSNVRDQLLTWKWSVVNKMNDLEQLLTEFVKEINE